MRKGFAVICVLATSLLLAAIILAQSVFSHLKDPDLLVQTAKAADLYEMAIDQLKMQLLREANKSGLPLMSAQNAKGLVRRMIPEALFESELQTVLDSGVSWFNSNAPSSELVLKISLKELKQNLGMTASVMPNELSILEILPPDSRQNFLVRAEEIRGYYQLAQFNWNLILGVLIILGIFILLLTMTSVHSVLRFLGSALLLGGALAGAVSFGLPRIMPLIVRRMIPLQSNNIIDVAEFFVNNLFDSARVVSVAIFAGGIALIIFAQFLPRDKNNKDLSIVPRLN